MPKDTTFEIRAGHGQQLGANYDGKGVNFALFSAHAERVERSFGKNRNSPPGTAGIYP
ncbi:glycogen debranching protein GlgX [Enterobacter hormaechei]|nr:glycogen debranching protein GlgX [Enterobacter hormaechei]